MNIKDIMSQNVVTISPDESLYEGARKMRLNGIGCLPVVCDGLIKGIITDRDIVLYFARFGYLDSTIDKAMTKNVLTVNINANLESLIDMMSYSQIHRVPIVENKRLVGIVSLSDLARHKLTDSAFGILTEISYDPTRVYFQTYSDYLSDNADTMQI